MMWHTTEPTDYHAFGKTRWGGGGGVTHMLFRQLPVVLPQVLQQVLGVLCQEGVHIGGAGGAPDAPQVAVEALAEAGQHQGPQVFVLRTSAGLILALSRLIWVLRQGMSQPGGLSKWHRECRNASNVLCEGMFGGQKADRQLTAFMNYSIKSTKNRATNS